MNEPAENQNTTCLEIAPGLIIQQRDIEAAVDHLFKCNSFARWAVAKDQDRISIEQKVGEAEIWLGLHIFETLLFFCDFTASEWAYLARRAGYPVKELDEMWKVVVIVQSGRWGSPPEGKPIIDPGILWSRRSPN